MIGYEKRNVNPKNRKTGDCVVRAISVAADMGYEQVIRDLFERGLKKGYVFNDRRNYQAYLESLGFTKHPQPRKWDGRKYQVGEIDQLIQKNQVAIISMAHHLVGIVDSKIVDIWDCRDKCIGNYWTRG